MKGIYTLFAVIATAVLAPSHALAAAEFGTANEAKAMVGKAIVHIKAVGKEKAYADFMDMKNSAFHDRDLFVAVQDLAGNMKAHGTSPKIAGKNLMEMKDPEGKLFIKERVEFSKTKDAFWHDYTFFDPITKKPLPKSNYCEKFEDLLVCSGIFKR